MLWIGVHLPELSLECFIATLPARAPDPSAASAPAAAAPPAGAGPDQSPGPVALVAQHRLVAVNAAANDCGLRVGQKRATALGLAPQTRLGEADPMRDDQALQAVAHVLMAFTPAVSIAPGHVVLAEVQASLRYFGGWPRLLERLRAALASLGHVVRVARAPTPQAAHWLATWRDDAQAAPVPASRTQDGWRASLEPFPVALMAAARPHLDTLQTLGLVTLADLRRQPRAGLVRRFGGELLADIDRALGDLADPRSSMAPPRRFDSRLELFMRADDSAALLAGAAVLLNRLAAWAAACHGRIAAFRLLLHHETRLSSRSRAGADPSARTTVLELRLGEPVSDTAHLQVLLRERLQRQPLAASVIELSLQCEELVAGAPPNRELFPSAAGEAEGWQRLVERLEARLGAQNVRQLQPVADHRPEQATASRPLQQALARPCGSRPQRSPPLRAAASQAPGGAALSLPPASDGERAPAGIVPGDWPRQRRPVWLLPQPQPLREAGGTPLLAGHPLWLLAGPERIEAGWWDETPASRDYFIAQAEDGTLLWVYRFRHAPPAGDSGWYLHGRYG